MLDEEAKAAQEVARTTGKALEIVKASGQALAKVFGETFQQLGGITADWVRYLRFRNTLLIADKVNAILESRHIERRIVPLPPAMALPLLEGASLESEDEVQRLWAGLIANAADPGRTIILRKVFIEILRGLEPLDVKLLEFLSDPELDKTYTILVRETLNADVVALRLNADIEHVKISLQTLARYGCVIDSWEQTLDSLDRGYSGFRVNNPKSNFRLSHLGQQLVHASRVT